MVSRNELYRLVWSEPMTRIAERFEVSGSYLARVCILLNVPRPERGYWAKLAVGKAPPKPALPTPQPCDPLHWSTEGERIVAPRPQAPPRRKPEKKVRIARNQIHGLIRGAKLHFENSRPVDEGAYLKPYKKLLVDVTASKANLDKALDLANDLFNALHSVGHRVVLAPSDAKLGRARVDERESATKPREYWQQHSVAISADGRLHRKRRHWPFGHRNVGRRDAALCERQVCSRERLYSAAQPISCRPQLDDDARTSLRPHANRCLFSVRPSDLVQAVAGNQVDIPPQSDQGHRRSDRSGRP